MERLKFHETVMIPNLPKTFLKASAQTLLVAGCFALATVVMAGQGQTDVRAASKSSAPSAEKVVEIDWSVYQQW